MKLIIIGGCGYVGSYLTRGLRAAGHDVVTLDLKPEADIQVDYRNLTAHRIAKLEVLKADAVLWFAGVSTVAAAIDNPLDALSSNALGLVALRSNNLNPDTRLIYASTASLYSVGQAETKPWPCDEDELIPPTNRTAYDRSKFTFDYIQTGFLNNCLGLRMGTVAGWSTSFSATRLDSCFNAMNRAAILGGPVTVTRPNAWRTILFLSDLLDVVRTALDRPELCPYPILNVGSMDVSMHALGSRIATFHAVNLVTNSTGPASPYSFRLDLHRQTSLIRRRPITDLEGQCQSFLDSWRAEAPQSSLP